MTPMLRRVVMHVVAVGSGVAMVTALTKAAGPVPAWIGFLCGWAVTVVSLAGVRVKVDLREGEERTGDDSLDE